MSTKRSKPAPRKPRADAQRNRERILEVAKQAFTRSGADTSLDDIAKQAGVGPGTLYRHFPTRDVLLEAVYRSEVEKLAAAERKFAAAMPPMEALRAWMLLFIDYIAAKKIIAPALNTLVGVHAKVIEASYAQIHGAIRALVKLGIQSGEIRKDLDAIDLLKALIGVAYAPNRLSETSHCMILAARSGLFGWTGACDENVYQPLGTLLPIGTEGHMGDTDYRPKQIGGLDISSHIAALFRALHQFVHRSLDQTTRTFIEPGRASGHAVEGGRNNVLRRDVIHEQQHPGSQGFHRRHCCGELARCCG